MWNFRKTCAVETEAFTGTNTRHEAKLQRGIRLPASSPHWVILLSNCLFLYNGVYWVDLMLSVCDVIVSQKSGTMLLDRSTFDQSPFDSPTFDQLLCFWHWLDDIRSIRYHWIEIRNFTRSLCAKKNKRARHILQMWVWDTKEHCVWV